MINNISTIQTIIPTITVVLELVAELFVGAGLVGLVGVVGVGAGVLFAAAAAICC